MSEMQFVSEPDTEPDTPRSSLDLSTSTTPSDHDPPSISQGSKRKRKAGCSDDGTNAARKLMYETAIKFMQQEVQPTPPPQPVTDEDMFGQYVASQLKLISDPQAKLNIKLKINNLFLMHQMETTMPVNQQYLSLSPSF